MKEDNSIVVCRHVCAIILAPLIKKKPVGAQLFISNLPHCFVSKPEGIYMGAKKGMGLNKKSYRGVIGHLTTITLYIWCCIKVLWIFFTTNGQMVGSFCLNRSKSLPCACIKNYFLIIRSIIKKYFLGGRLLIFYS